MIYGTRDGKFIVKKLSVQDKMPVSYSIPDTAAAGTADILTGTDINANGTSAYTNTGILVQPPYPMCLHLNWNAAGTADSSDALVVVGVDAMNKVVTDTLTITSAASGNAYTSNAYAKITTITPNQVCKSTDIGIGFRNYIGLPYPIASSGDIYSYSYGSAFSTTNAVANALTISSQYNTLKLPTMGAGKSVHILYQSKVQE